MVLGHGLNEGHPAIILYKYSPRAYINRGPMAMVDFTHDWIGDFDNVQKEMGRLLDYLGNSKPPMVNFASSVWEPSVDVYETLDQVVVQVEVAAVDMDRISIAIEGNTLVLVGQREEKPSQGHKTYYQMEIQRGSFSRNIVLPCGVNIDAVEATYRDGLIEIVLPKTQKDQRTQVRLK